MIIYNVTTKLSWAIYEKWVQWMKEKHIPEVMRTGCFTEYRFARLLETDESEGPTYSIQYTAEEKALYETYIAHHAPALRQDMLNTWGDQFISFRSLLELVD